MESVALSQHYCSMHLTSAASNNKRHFQLYHHFGFLLVLLSASEQAPTLNINNITSFMGKYLKYNIHSSADFVSLPETVRSVDGGKYLKYNTHQQICFSLPETVRSVDGG